MSGTTDVGGAHGFATNADILISVPVFESVTGNGGGDPLSIIAVIVNSPFLEKYVPTVFGGAGVLIGDCAASVKLYIMDRNGVAVCVNAGIGTQVVGDGAKDICNGVNANALDGVAVDNSKYVPFTLPIKTRPGASVINAISPGCRISFPVPGYDG